MSNHLSKKNIPEIAVKARKHLKKIMKDNYVAEMFCNVYDALESDDIDYVKGMLQAFLDEDVTRYIREYAKENKLDDEMLREIIFQYDKAGEPEEFGEYECYDDFKKAVEEEKELDKQKEAFNKKLHDDYKNTTSYTINDDTVLLDGKPIYKSQLDELNRKSKEELKDADLPQELKDLMNNCNGMKIDEFYRKMDEIAKKNGGEVKHSRLGKEMLKNGSNIINMDDYKKKK